MPTLAFPDGMDASQSLRLRMLLALGVAAALPVTFLAAVVVLPALHGLLLRCFRVRWPFWYCLADTVHTCSWAVFALLPVLLVGAGCAVCRVRPHGGWVGGGRRLRGGCATCASLQL